MANAPLKASERLSSAAGHGGLRRLDSLL